MGLRGRFGAVKSRLIALNVHDAMMQLTEGSCDLLIAYHHPTQPLRLSAERYEMLTLGEESLRAYAKAGPDGEPLFRLPARPGDVRLTCSVTGLTRVRVYPAAFVGSPPSPGAGLCRALPVIGPARWDSVAVSDMSTPPLAESP
jgi:hypothetical protein